MKLRARAASVALAALLGCAAIGVAAQAPLPAPSASTITAIDGAELLAALREGGHILYFRHTATDFGENDARMTSYDDCTTQRNLTDAGRADARAIGAALRDLGIPVARVTKDEWKALATRRP